MSWRQYRKIDVGEQFMVFADTATGLGDYCACQFLSKTNLDVPLVYHSKKLATEMTNEIFPVIERVADVTGKRPIVAYERNNGGVFEMERLASLNRANKFEIFKMPNYGQGINNPDSDRLGWDTNVATRPKMLSELKDAIDKGVLMVYDRPTINEMFSFIIVNTTATRKAQAERGAHDDLVMSLAGAWQLFQDNIDNAGSGTWGGGPFSQFVSKALSPFGGGRGKDPHIGL